MEVIESGGICENGFFVNSLPQEFTDFPLICPPDLFPAKEVPVPELEPIYSEMPAKRAKTNRTNESSARASRNYRKRQKEAVEEMANQQNRLNLRIASLKVEKDALDNTVWTITGELQKERQRIVQFEQEVRRLRQLVADQSLELEKLRAPAH